MNLERPPTYAHLERLLRTRLASLAREVLSWWSLRVPLLLFPSRGGQRYGLKCGARGETVMVVDWMRIRGVCVPSPYYVGVLYLLHFI
jgi:hypothetical protein